MKKTLFNPKQIALPQNLVLIPRFWDDQYYQQIKEKAITSFNLLFSELVLFDNFTLVVNFLGYPHILTLLEFIEDVRDKEVYFLGTAGSLNPDYQKPTPLIANEICSSGPLDHYGAEKSYQLKDLPKMKLNRAKGVTVDIIQRETVPWFKEQIERGIDFVEMEIFPLRAYLEKPFTALVVTSDLLKETGIELHKDKILLKKEFVRCYEWIIQTIK
jgi:hypothetical protein